MTALSPEEEAQKLSPLAIRGWIEISLSPKEKQLLATGLLAVGVLGGDVKQAMLLADKLGVGDLIDEQASKLLDAAEAARFPP